MTSTPFVMAVPDPGVPGSKPPFDPFECRAKALFRFDVAPKGMQTFAKSPQGCRSVPSGFATPPMVVAVERLNTRLYPAVDAPKSNVNSDYDFDVGDPRVVLAAWPDRLLRGKSQSCRIDLLSDGQLACRDAMPLALQYAGDLQCGRQLALFDDPFVAPKRVLMLMSEGGLCLKSSSKVVSAKQIPFEQTQLFSLYPDANGTCAPVGASAHPGHPVFELGADPGLTAADFVLGEPTADTLP